MMGWAMKTDHPWRGSRASRAKGTRRIAWAMAAIATLAALRFCPWILVRALVFLFGAFFLLLALGIFMLVLEQIRPKPRSLAERAPPDGLGSASGRVDTGGPNIAALILLLPVVLLVLFGGALVAFAIVGHTLTLPWGTRTDPGDFL